MATEVHTDNNQQSMTALVGGIVTDAQQLMSQQLALFRSEIKQDTARSVQAGTLMGIGLGIGLVAGVVLVFALAHLLQWLSSNQEGVATMPLWVAYLIVGAVVATLGCSLFYAGKKQFEAFNPLPDKSAQALQENVQWLTNTQK